MHLVPHPQTPPDAVKDISAAVWRSGDRWHFRYLLKGRADLVLPPPADPARADGLWQHTCFEAFVGLDGAAYLEFNFSPSGRWAAYRFDTPRQGMREEAAEIDIYLDAGADWLGIEAAVLCRGLEPERPLGLSAVIEESGGRKSYWALRHPAGPPDFHDRSCFVAGLANIAAP